MTAGHAARSAAIALAAYVNVFRASQTIEAPKEKYARGREGQTGQHNRLARRGPSSALMSPFTLLQRFFSDDVGSLFEQFGGHRDGMMPQARGSNRDVTSWVPKVDIVERGNELVVRADLPGVKPDDVTVEISADAITISGERQDEHAEERGDIYRFERIYGAFLREIPLPEGAMVDQAKASFKGGVLEVTVPAPPGQVSRGRRLEISQRVSLRFEVIRRVQNGTGRSSAFRIR